VLENNNLEQEFTITPETTQHIQAQARIAFSKANRMSAMDLEDYVSIGYQVYWQAQKTWDSTKGTKFSTYLTLCLQRNFYKVNSKGMRKKRGGAGNKAEDQRFGRGKRWENGRTPPGAVHVSIDVDVEEESSGAIIQLESLCDNNAEYELLVEQVSRMIKDKSHQDYLVFKQMVDPDSELLQMAADHAKKATNRKCIISEMMLANYLKMNKLELAEAVARIRTVVAEELQLATA
jgi:hypothetical protein